VLEYALVRQPVPLPASVAAGVSGPLPGKEVPAAAKRSRRGRRGTRPTRPH
jgi:hypothetical protein